MNSFNFNKTDYVIYTDGACLGNPGKGGWAALIFFEDKKKVYLDQISPQQIIEWNLWQLLSL